MPIARNGVRRSDAQAVQARAARLPNLSLSWQGQTSKSVVPRGFSGSGRNTTRDLQLLLSQTFFQSGLREQVRAAFSSADASRYLLANTRRNLVLNVATDYYTALATRALVDVARRAVVSSKQHLDAADARITAGKTARADRYPFEVELAQAQLQVVINETQAGVALSNLKATMGLPADTPLQLADALSRPPLPTDLSDLVRRAYETRPDVQQQQALVRSARELLAAARTERGPVLSATGDVAYGDFTGDRGTEWQLGLGVTMPVFDAGLSGAKVEAARADLSTAEETLRQAKLDVGSEVERNYLTAAQSRAAIDTAETAVAAARVSLDAATGKYSEGKGTVIDVTDAELRLRQAESGYVQALYNYNTALAALKASLALSPAPGLE
jgi:outer membrane protein